MDHRAAVSVLLSALLALPAASSAAIRVGRGAPAGGVSIPGAASVSGARPLANPSVGGVTPLVATPMPLLAPSPRLALGPEAPTAAPAPLPRLIPAFSEVAAPADAPRSDAPTPADAPT
ncbi:MAG: hypothetical protein SF051_06995, partial [Elusimicrobiota bacterium]|nr:hypothetical protein [Elusimicrobiota bacterium]